MYLIASVAAAVPHPARAPRRPAPRLRDHRRRRGADRRRAAARDRYALHRAGAPRGAGTRRRTGAPTRGAGRRRAEEVLPADAARPRRPPGGNRSPRGTRAPRAAQRGHRQHAAGVVAAEMSADPRICRSAQCLHAAALLALPRWLRDRYGDDMRTTFAARCGDAAAAGRLPLVSLLFRELADVLAAAVSALTAAASTSASSL